LTTQAESFHGMLRSGEMIFAPGAHNCFTTCMVDQASYSACYMSRP